MPRQPMTLTQKILTHHAVGLEKPFVQAGDILQIRVDWTIASELAWNGMEKTYAKLGRPKLHDPRRFFLAVDHTVDPVTLAGDARTQKLVQLSRSFARESGIAHFYDANQTILHTKFYRDLLQPGEVVLGADSHTSSHGGLGAFAIGLGGADVTAAMVLGQSWIEVPEAICVEYVGRLPFGFVGKDIILTTLGRLGRNTVAMERTVEYRAEFPAELSTDTRFAIANMTAEFGGLNGIFEADGVVAQWLAARTEAAYTGGGALYFRADADAPYRERFAIELGRLEPLIAKPFSPDNTVPAQELAQMALQGVFVGACTTTEEELVLGALVLEAALAEGKTPVPAPGKRLVVPGDLSIQARLAQAGLWAIYERAGFRVGVPGCSMCLGVASEKAEPGEHWLSSQNRNYRNRMGEGSLAYLASAATVAASALELRVADPRPLLARVSPERFARLLGRTQSPPPEVRPIEPAVAAPRPVGAPHPGVQGASQAAGAPVRGRIQRFGDHIDTDAIIPGQFCHLTSLEELGAKCFALVRPDFAAKVRAGCDIIVAGEAWGSGSSREQAVWALQGAGVRAVIARSFAFIHKRNLVNEALPYWVVEDSEFYELAKEDEAIELDPKSGQIRLVGRTFAARGASPMVQALQREGGLVPAIQRHGQDVFSRLR